MWYLFVAKSSKNGQVAHETEFVVGKVPEKKETIYTPLDPPSPAKVTKEKKAAKGITSDLLATYVKLPKTFDLCSSNPSSHVVIKEHSSMKGLN